MFYLNKSKSNSCKMTRVKVLWQTCIRFDFHLLKVTILSNHRVNVPVFGQLVRLSDKSV